MIPIGSGGRGVAPRIARQSFANQGIVVMRNSVPVSEKKSEGKIRERKDTKKTEVTAKSVTPSGTLH